MVPFRICFRYMALLLTALKEGHGQATDVNVRILAPSWVARGGSATLRCLHQVPPQLLYKVEFSRVGSKILQYIRERNPPYVNYSFLGGNVNMSLVTEDSVTLDNLDPSASGLYWCEVSLETPIYTATSPPHQLTVVYSQKHPPIITFGKPDVVVGGLLRANCTSAPAAPAPKLTWYIGNEQVPEDSLRHFSYRVSSSTRNKGGGVRRRKYQHRYIAPELNYTAKYWRVTSDTTLLPPYRTMKQNKCTLKEDLKSETVKMHKRLKEAVPHPISLWVSIVELRTPARGKLQLTCTATIPDQVGPGERYADIKKQTVTVAINELSFKRPSLKTTHANGTSTRKQNYYPILFIGFGIIINGLSQRAL